MKRKRVLGILISIILFILCTNPSYATATGNGDGDGKGEVLELVESTPKNNQQGVKLDSEIKLVFNKNIVNMAVKDNNLKCFSLKDSNNQTISIDVIFPDDQVEPDRKREVVLKPHEALKENMSYRVEITKKLQAKNGISLTKDLSFSFSTSPLPNVNGASKTNEKTSSNIVKGIIIILLLIAAGSVFAAVTMAKKRKL